MKAKAINSSLILTQTSLSMTRAHTRTLTVRWGSWTPLLHPNTHEVTMALVGGPQRSPDDALVYKLPATNMQHESTALSAGGLIAFRWARDGVKNTFIDFFLPYVNFHNFICSFILFIFFQPLVFVQFRTFSVVVQHCIFYIDFFKVCSEKNHKLSINNQNMFINVFTYQESIQHTMPSSLMVPPYNQIGSAGSLRSEVSDGMLVESNTSGDMLRLKPPMSKLR